MILNVPKLIGWTLSLFVALGVGFICSAAILIVFPHWGLISLFVFIGSVYTEGQVYIETVPNALEMLLVGLTVGMFAYFYYEMLLRELKQHLRKNINAEKIRRVLKKCFSDKAFIAALAKKSSGRLYREANLHAKISWLVVLPVSIINGAVFGFITYTHTITACRAVFAKLGWSGSIIPSFALVVAVATFIAYSLLMYQMLEKDILLNLKEYWTKFRDFFKHGKFFHVLGIVIVFVLVLLITIATAGAWTNATIACCTKIFNGSKRVITGICKISVNVFSLPIAMIFSFVNCLKSIRYILGGDNKEANEEQANEESRWDKFSAYARRKYPGTDNLSKFKFWGSIIFKGILYFFAWTITIVCFFFHVVAGVPGEGAKSINLSLQLELVLTWMAIGVGTLIEFLTDFPFVFMQEDEHHDDGDLAAHDHSHTLLPKLVDSLYSNESHHHEKYPMPWNSTAIVDAIYKVERSGNLQAESNFSDPKDLLCKSVVAQPAATIERLRYRA